MSAKVFHVVLVCSCFNFSKAVFQHEAGGCRLAVVSGLESFDALT